MNRLMILAAAATMIGVGKVVVDPPDDLQAASPGTQQTGNINVSGAVLGGTFFGTSSGSTTKVVSGWATSPSGFVYGGDFRSASTDGRGVFASATATTGSTYGGDFRSASPAGRGIFGFATATSGGGIGGDFRSNGPQGIGVVGRALATSGLTTGGAFQTDSVNGLGMTAKSTATSGDTYAGVFDAVTSSGTSSAGLFRQNSATGNVIALRAKVTLSTSGSAKGAYVDGNHGYGLYSVALGATGVGIFCEGSDTGISAVGDNLTGVSGASSSKNSYGVYGQVPPAGTGAAIYANGVLAASGTKTMRIDHPDDPENKYLLQYCAEGDTPQLQYRGVVRLDSNGAATVALPSYFDKINRDPSYQLTPMGAPMPNLYLAQEESHNEFKIAGGKPGMKVSWTVTGIRNDRFVQKYGAKNEIDKPDESKGTYLMPELYNQPAERGETYNPKLQREKDQEPQIALSHNRSK